jgi:thiol-disulfide isomerase/thioredoxin
MFLKPINILIVFLLLSIIVSCKQTHEANNDVVVIVESSVDSTVFLEFSFYRYWKLPERRLEKVSIKKGNNPFNIKVDKFDYAYIEYLKETIGAIFFVPGDTIKIGFNGSEIIREGQQKEYLDISMMIRNLNISHSLNNTGGIVDYKRYYKKIDSVEKSLKSVVNEYNFPNEVKKNLESTISYDLTSRKLKYLFFHYLMNESEKIEFPNESLDILKKIEYNKPEFLMALNYHYYSFLDNLFRVYYFLETSKLDKRMNTLENFDFKNDLIEEYFSDFAKDYVLYASLDETVESANTKEIFEELSTWLNTNKNEFINEAYFTTLSGIFLKYEKLLQGAPVPDFSLPTINGDTVSITQFNDKIVFVDFWGTWCPYCLDEIVFAKKLYEKYKHNKDIQFISIALEYENWDRWLETIDKLDVPGFQMYMNKQFGNPVAKQLMVSGIPQFMIFNKGKIVTSNAPRPSNPRLEKELDSLIKIF